AGPRPRLPQRPPRGALPRDWPDRRRGSAARAHPRPCAPAGARTTAGRAPTTRDARPALPHLDEPAILPDVAHVAGVEAVAVVGGGSRSVVRSRCGHGRRAGYVA